MTQEEYGRFLGVTQVVVFDIEAGRSSIGIDNLKKFDLNTTSQNIETLLTSKKRQKLVRVITASEWGGEIDKYVLKL